MPTLLPLLALTVEPDLSIVIRKGIDENQELQFNQPQAPAQINNSKDALQIPSGPITRSRAQKLKEALIGLIQDILTAQTKSKIELKPNHVLNLIWADEGIK